MNQVSYHNQILTSATITITIQHQKQQNRARQHNTNLPLSTMQQRKSKVKDMTDTPSVSLSAEPEPSQDKTSKTRAKNSMLSPSSSSTRILLLLAFLLSSVVYWCNRNDNDNVNRNSDPSSKNEKYLEHYEQPQAGKNTQRIQIQQEVDRKLHNAMPPIQDHETIFSSFIVALIRESMADNANFDLIPEGAFLDSGCQFGEQAAHYAVAAPNRQVIALDPSPSNLERVKNDYGSLTNLVIKQGGLGQKIGSMIVPDGSFQMPIGTEFPIYTLDSMFYDQGEKLAFAHLDVEGLELDVLKGGVKTIRDSKPLFTTEVRVHKDPEYTDNLLDFISELGYDSYVINEVCGYPHMDYRNLLNVPRSKSSALKYSEIFVLLHATQSIMRLPTKSEGQKTIFDLVAPCCKLGSTCCPGSDVNAKDCCSEDRVKKFLEENKPDVNPYFHFWKGARTEFNRLRYRLGQRQKVMPQ